ncbi:MAG: peptidase S8/S53 subtilisin kexin sedolisin [Terriglobia bacterium]|nr:MAG: peptidase S8/S53 subtilisin kexin sedolisin [Terriglobia bacterium]
MDNPENRASQQPKLISYIIAPPVKQAIEAAKGQPGATINVIINLVESREKPEEGVGPAKAAIKKWIAALDYPTNVRESDFYLFASLRPEDIQALSTSPDVYQIWLDEQCQAHLLQSCDTIKASACWRTFDARGKGITWAVMDTGIRYDHPHFQLYDNIDKQLSKNFSASPTEEDRFGHGTHVAGIIAGAPPQPKEGDPYLAATYLENADEPRIDPLDGCPSGVAPMARLINVKVLDDQGNGAASAAILGLEHLRKINQSSREIRVDGVNMSLGYPFDPKWYGCGFSPLCQEVRRTVNSGIIVVVSCGNAGYGVAKVEGRDVPMYLELSVADPANTEEAISVGAVHKSAPHRYGVSYFSSKGPTGDGRLKPDLVAPGEKVISCSIQFDSAQKKYHYEEKSGTSMAAPHVSGSIAAFLSVHREYRGDPQAVKEVLMKTATDLGRQRNFQGAGMVDLMRAIMSV